MFIILNEKGKYVSRPGSQKSYTTKLENARIFSTKEAAESNKCSNERVVSLYDLMK